MSLPNIPNITPHISLDRCDTINLLLSSIALEEIGLSHILNAEGEKLQHFLKKPPCHLEDFLAINKSINKTLGTIVKSQMMLVLKLEDVVDLVEQTQSKGTPTCKCRECKKPCQGTCKNVCCQECGKPCQGTCKNVCCKKCGKPCQGTCKIVCCKKCGKPCGGNCCQLRCKKCGKSCEGILTKPCCNDCRCYEDTSNKEDCFFILKESKTTPHFPPANS